MSQKLVELSTVATENHNMSDETLFTPYGLGLRLDVPKSTIIRWLKSGVLTGGKHLGHWRITGKAVKAFLARFNGTKKERVDGKEAKAGVR